MKTISTIGILLILLVLFGLIGGCGYNKLINLDENVSSAWAQVQNAYQTRADLIPNLVNTVKGAADFEKSTLEAVTNARASATQVKFDASNLTEANLAAFEKAQQQVSGALSRLLVAVEAYPNLKANQNFLELQAQLEGTERRINVERKRFNDAVQGYNSAVRSFPNNMIAGFFGFEKKPYFESKEGAEVAPNVNF